MISTEDLSQLLAILYAAPLQPEKWQTFFDHLSRLTNISSGYFLSGSQSQGYEVLAGGGFAWNQDAMQIMNERYARADPFAIPFFRNPRNAIIPGEELVPKHQLLKTEFYNDFLINNEMETVTMMSCTSTPEQVDVMPVWRRKQDGPMDEASIALLKMLLPHAQIALQMRRSLQGANAKDEFTELALEAITAAALLVSDSGNVLHMNKLAAALLHKGDGLRLEGAFLTARNARESDLLSLLIAGSASASRNGTAASPGGALQISRQGTQHPLQVAVLPIPVSSRSIFGLPCALVFVSDPSASQKSRADLMRMLYGLTPTESRLADLLLQGLEIRETAEQLRITIETARFHVKRILAKTGSGRQAGLMKLMLSLPGRQSATADPRASSSAPHT
jgi:DNA-binding CsgD family transcriptional regulator